MRLLERLRRRDYPLPAYQPLHEVDGAAVVLQEVVPGRVSDDVSTALIWRMVVLSELQAGLGIPGDRSWGTMVLEHLTIDRPGRRFLPEAAAVGSAVTASDFPSADAMHSDLHHQNVLQLNGELRAVIDWEGCRPGDRWYDLVIFAVCLAAAQVPAGSVGDLWRHLRAHVAPDVLAAYAVLIGLRLVEWSLQPDTPYRPELWVDSVRRAIR